MVTELGLKTVPPCPTVTFVVAARQKSGDRRVKRATNRRKVREGGFDIFGADANRRTPPPLAFFTLAFPSRRVWFRHG
jgi:hypothetical protein